MNHPVYGATDLYFRKTRSMWFVNYNVPKALQGQLLNKSGKPLTRREKSTGTSDERIARKRHPVIQAELFAELDQLRLKNPTDEIKRGLSTSHQQLTEGLNTYDEEDVLSLKKAAEHETWLQHAVDKEVKLLSEQLLKSKGLSLDNLDLVIPSLNKVIEDVLENERRKKELGVYAEPTKFLEVIKEAETEPLTLSKVFTQYKTKELSDRSTTNTSDAIRHWIFVVGSEALTDVTKANMHQYLADMQSGKTFSGKAAGIETCNARASQIINLLKLHNAYSDPEIPIPAYRRLAKTNQDRKDEARKNANKPISDVNAIKILDVLWKKGQSDDDQMQSFKGVLLLACTPFRAEQVALLRWGHIVKEHGIWVFDFLMQDGNAKTIASLNQVLPLHQTLVNLLLPMRGDAKDDDFILNHQNCWALRDRPSQGFNDLLQKRDKTTKFGVPQNEPCNAHSFRHRFGDRAMAASESDFVVKQVLGHTIGNDTTRRYSRAKLETLNKVVQQSGIEYEPR